MTGIIVDKSKVLPKYLYYILSNQKEYINSIASGATIKEVRPLKLLESLYLPLPPLEEQEKIVTCLDAIEKSIKSAEEFIENLKAEGGSFLRFSSEVENFEFVALGEICEINPRKPKLEDTLEVSFIDMATMPVEGYKFKHKETRKISEERYLKYLRDTPILQKMMSYLQKLHLALRMENAELQQV